MRRYLVTAAIVAAALSGSTSAWAESAKPADPNGYAEVVSFGAREDHDLHPAPGNVVGGVRSEIATTGDGQGVSTFVQERRELTGSVPNPPSP